jgi:hypothetical protein
MKRWRPTEEQKIRKAEMRAARAAGRRKARRANERELWEKYKSQPSRPAGPLTEETLT